MQAGRRRTWSWQMEAAARRAVLMHSLAAHFKGNALHCDRRSQVGLNSRCWPVSMQKCGSCHLLMLLAWAMTCFFWV